MDEPRHIPRPNPAHPLHPRPLPAAPRTLLPCSPVPQRSPERPSARTLTGVCPGISPKNIYPHILLLLLPHGPLRWIDSLLTLFSSLCVCTCFWGDNLCRSGVEYLLRHVWVILPYPGHSLSKPKTVGCTNEQVQMGAPTSSLMGAPPRRDSAQFEAGESCSSLRAWKEAAAPGAKHVRGGLLLLAQCL